MHKRKILVSLLAVVTVLSLLIVPALAEGDGNIDGGGGSGDGGGGMGEGSKQNYWNNEDGCRITILKNGQKVYSMDWSNQPESASVKRSFVPKNKLDYLHGSSLAPKWEEYTSTVVPLKMPTIVGGAGGNNIEAIKRYFTDKNVIESISGGIGVPYNDLTGGEYKLLLEPIAYFVFKGDKWAMTATEAALYDVTVEGQLRAWMKSLTHQNLPLSMFLEKSDTELHLDKWTGARSGKQTNADIIRYLGMGIVSFKAAPPPVTPGEYDYEFHTDTDVIISFQLFSNEEIAPDDDARAVMSIGGKSYYKSFICPEGGSQLVWMQWHTPSTPQTLTATAFGGDSSVTLRINVTELEENIPPDPTYYDRNDGFTLPVVPDYGSNLSTTWGEWYAEEFFGVWLWKYVTYSASLQIHDSALNPDQRCKTAYRMGNGQTTMKSGYAVEISVDPMVQYGAGVSSYDVTPIQNAVATFPEFGYEEYNRLLEKVDVRRWAFKQNPFSYYSNRIHYTPLWYPDDMAYTVPVRVLDAWTPGGQLYTTVNESLYIFDDVINDWYIHVTN
ncbi:MAG: hypothetical protein VB060_08825 [Oscillibacter sp.]|uniref:hypothetical protein n=1 Tax=uncultured Oscillibacter sp. TaxID=876091 RepID=UPI0025FE8F49|nr:hypothetical protein [Oscillibacter sp.]MEA4993916.1 hypothetical protein [Oscillibacter sp.]